MFEIRNLSTGVRNLSIYALGVGLAVAGALGLAEAIRLSFVASLLLFVFGLVIVIAVHEYLEGPI